MKQARVLLADDHSVVAQGFRTLLEREFNVAGIAPNGRVLLDLAQQLQPDVVLMDIGMPLLNGIDAAVQLKKDMPRLKIIFLTMHADRAYVTAAFRAGASGYLLKQSDPSELAFAIREVLKGHIYVTPTVAGEVIAPLTHGTESGSPEQTQDQLTRRQRQVLQLVAEGHTTKEIAKILSISVKTADCHKAQIKHQLRLHTTAALTKYAIEHGLVEKTPTV